jgi:hypothetical protein
MMNFKNYSLLQGLLDDEGGAGTPPPAQTTQPPANDTPSELADFLKGIDADLAKEPMLKNYKDINTMVKSLVHAQKSIGKDKVVLPTNKSTKEEWADTFKKLGKPESVDKYGIDTKKSKIGEEFAKGLLDKAFESNLLPAQVTELVKFLEDRATTEVENAKKKLEDEVANDLKGLKAEWGEGYDKQINFAKTAIKELADDGFKTYLKDSGLENDVNLIKFLSKVGQAMGNAEFHGKGAESFGLTNEEVKGKIAAIRSNHNGPLYDKSHGDHKRTVEELENLYKKLN